MMYDVNCKGWRELSHGVLRYIHIHVRCEDLIAVTTKNAVV
jgi:hypothetical protein